MITILYNKYIIDVKSNKIFIKRRRLVVCENNFNHS